MTDTNQKQLGNTLWSIADQLRGAQEARRRTFHQRRRALRQRQTPEPTEPGAHRQDHRRLPIPKVRAPLRPARGDGGDRKERLQPEYLTLHQYGGGRG